MRIAGGSVTDQAREGHANRGKGLMARVSGAATVSRGVMGAMVLMLAVACTPIYRNHGYVPAPEELAQIKIGSTREEVANVIGRPSAEALLGDGGWYYVQSRWETYGARAPKEVDRQVLAVSFDKAGRVSNIEHFGLEKGRIVTLSRRVTTTSVQNSTFLRQLFQSVGRVSADQLLGTSTD